MTDDTIDPLVSVAVCVRAHGLRGELRIKVWNEESELLSSLDRVVLRSKDGTSRPARIENARPAGDHWLAGFAGVRDRDAAEALRGSEILVRREDFPELEQDEVYLVDLLGYEVWEGDVKRGVVDGFFEYPSVDCLKVVSDGGDFELPMLDGFVVGIDEESRRVLAARVDELPVEPKRAPR